MWVLAPSKLQSKSIYPFKLNTGWRRSIWFFVKLWKDLPVLAFPVFTLHMHSPPPLGSGGNDFCVISQAGGQLLNFKSQGGDTFRGLKMILSRGDCFIMRNCWYFHKMLHLLFYKFRLRRYLIFLSDSWTWLLLLCICYSIWYLKINM